MIWLVTPAAMIGLVMVLGTGLRVVVSMTISKAAAGSDWLVTVTLRMLVV